MNKPEDRYINPLTDFGFKKLFGTEPNKDLLIDFLNEILPDNKVKDLTYATNEHFGKSEMDRKAIFDIYCIGENDERFIVEMQKAKQNYFKDRSLFYASFPIQEQGKKGDWDYHLEPVFSIGILDFEFDEHKGEEGLLHIIELKNQNCEVFYDKLKFIYIELPKFEKSQEQLETRFDKWMYVFTHLQKLQYRPKALQEIVFKKLFEVAEIAKFTEREKKEYENSLKVYRDMKNVVDTAKEEGKEEGREEGREEKEEEVIEKCMEEGMQPELISKIVNLPLAEVNRIIEKIQKRKKGL
ncbi:MAG: Rpn family recombination-promoting nuclease/putative transposase [Aureispira sp.]